MIFFSFSNRSRPALGPTQYPIQWYRGFSAGSKRPGREADYSPASSAEVQNEPSLYCPIRVHGVDRDFTFLIHAHALIHANLRAKCPSLLSAWNVSILQYQVSRKSVQQFPSCYMFTARYKSEAHCDIYQHYVPYSETFLFDCSEKKINS